MAQCQHLMATGRRCATPAVQTHRFCYHHRRLHDTYSLPGDAAYEPEPLDSHQAITLQLHHLELAFNRGRIDIRAYRARLLAVRLAITNLKHALTDPVTPADSVVTQYTPAMRDLHHLNPNQPCETANHLCEKCSAPLPVEEETRHEPDEIIEVEPLEPPCPIEWLQDPNYPKSKDNSRLWSPPHSLEWISWSIPHPNTLGTLQQENHRRRQRLQHQLQSIPNPTVFQIKDALSKIEAEEAFQYPDIAAQRQQLFQKHYGDLFPDLFPTTPAEPEAISGEGSYQGIASAPNEPHKITPAGVDTADSHSPSATTDPRPQSA